MDIIEWGIQFILDVISTVGYAGIILLMALESACLPVPSEIVMPFAGWLAYDGEFDLFLVALAGTIGCVLGSVIAYWIGYTGGRDLVLRYGKYIMLNEKHLDEAEIWFNKYGAWAVFVTRLLPIVRTFISLPTGMARYKFSHFAILTAIGSFVWCYFLAYIGYILGPEWRSIESSWGEIQIIVVIAVAVLFIWYIYRRRSKQKNESEKA